jgi:aminomethyltransferase
MLVELLDRRYQINQTLAAGGFGQTFLAEDTSGTLSPTLGYTISLAYVPTELASVGQQLEVEIRGKAYPAVVVKRPFYQSKNRLI